MAGGSAGRISNGGEREEPMRIGIHSKRIGISLSFDDRHVNQLPKLVGDENLSSETFREIGERVESQLVLGDHRLARVSCHKLHLEVLPIGGDGPNNGGPPVTVIRMNGLDCHPCGEICLWRR